MALSDIRKSYQFDSLNEQDLYDNPTEQFKQWLNVALDADLREPTAMTLATSSPQGRPSARMVLLKGIQEDGFVFYSNYSSRKGHELLNNPFAALLFYWDALERQVRIEGQVSRLTREASLAYFKQRPYGSQLGALASQQSQEVASREVLDAELSRIKALYPEDGVPLPDSWGGCVLTPERFEFWQGRPNRMHDRIMYEKNGERWRKARLSP